MREWSDIFVAVLAMSLASCATQRAARQIDHPTTADATVDSAFPPTMGELSFESGGSKLNGLMYVANGPGPHPTVIFLHGYPGNERNLDLAQAVRRAGMNVLYFATRPLLLVAATRDEITPKTDHHDRVIAALRQVGADRLTEVVLDDDHLFSAHRIGLARSLVDWLRAECWPGSSGIARR